MHDGAIQHTRNSDVCNLLSGIKLIGCLYELSAVMLIGLRRDLEVQCVPIDGLTSKYSKKKVDPMFPCLVVIWFIAARCHVEFLAP